MGELETTWDGERELSDGEPQTTNNRMELCAVIHGLRALKRRCRVTISTDSEYVMLGFTKGRLERWKERGWMTSQRKRVANRDLWEQLEAEVAKHEVSSDWVRGHTGHAYNERCHRLAVAAAEAQAARGLPPV